MDIAELSRVMEAILFAAGDPVESNRIMLVSGANSDEIEQAANKLSDMYRFERRGIRLLKLQDAYQLVSSSEYADYITRALETRKPPRLSASALETLSVIAYYQPTTKAFIEQIRGVDSTYTISALLNKKLIEEQGRLSVPGRPILYGTTNDFMRTFGLSTLEELPDVELPAIQSRESIVEQLSVDDLEGPQA